MKHVGRMGLVAAAALAGLLPGCANITLLRTEELRAVQARVDTLGARLSEQQKQQAELLRVVRADMQVRFSELSQSVSAMETGMSESQAKLKDIDKKTAEVRQRLDDKAHADSLRVAMQKTEEENLYQIAYGDFAAGRYDMAMAGFRDVIGRFPQSSKAELAAYWLAESRYAQRSYDSAEVAYTAYIKSYQSGEKICAALYKLGLVYDRKQKKEHQKKVWEKLQSLCPGSDEAQAAAAAGNSKGM